MKTIYFPPEHRPSLLDLTTDQLLKLMEIVKQVDGSSRGDHIRNMAYGELRRRIGYVEEIAPKREFSNINTSQDV